MGCKCPKFFFASNSATLGPSVETRHTLRHHRMRWPTRALVLVGLRFEDADAERRFAHSLRTKQLVSIIILQFAFVVIVVAVAVRLPPEADTPIVIMFTFLYSYVCIAALAYARKRPDLRRFWIPDALIAALSVFAPSEQYRMVSYWCRTDGMVCDQTYIAQNTHELTVTALLLVLSNPTRIVYLLPHAILLPSVIIADPDAAFLPRSDLQKSVPLLSNLRLQMRGDGFQSFAKSSKVLRWPHFVTVPITPSAVSMQNTGGRSDRS